MGITCIRGHRPEHSIDHAGQTTWLNGCAQCEVERLRAALNDAIECVESWSAYADEYFKTKHNLAADLARLRANAQHQREPTQAKTEDTTSDAVGSVIRRALIAAACMPANQGKRQGELRSAAVSLFGLDAVLDATAWPDVRAKRETTR